MEPGLNDFVHHSSIVPEKYILLILQLLKALFSMLVTLFGMVMEVKLLQPSKAYSLILLTLFGIVISPFMVLVHLSR